VKELLTTTHAPACKLAAPLDALPVELPEGHIHSVHTEVLTLQRAIKRLNYVLMPTLIA